MTAQTAPYRPVPASCCGGDCCTACTRTVDLDHDRYVQVVHRAPDGDETLTYHRGCWLPLVGGADTPTAPSNDQENPRP